MIHTGDVKSVPVPTASELNKINSLANAEAKRVQTQLPIPDEQATAMASVIRKAGQQRIVLSLYFMDVTTDSKLLVGLAIEKGIKAARKDTKEAREIVAKLVSASGKWVVKSRAKSDFVTKQLPFLAGRIVASRKFLALLGVRDNDLRNSVELYFLGAIERYSNSDFTKLADHSGHIKSIYALIKKGSPGAMQKITAKKNGAPEKIRKILAPKIPDSSSNLTQFVDLLNQGAGVAANGSQVLTWAEEYSKNYLKEIERARAKILGMKIDWAQKVRLAERITENLSSSRSPSSFPLEKIFNDFIIFKMNIKGTVSDTVRDLIHQDLKTQSDEVKARSPNRKGKISTRAGVNLVELEIGKAQKFAVENIVKMDKKTQGLFKVGGTIARRLGYAAIVMDAIKIFTAEGLEAKVAATISATGAAIGSVAGAKAGALAGGTLGASIAGPVGAAVGALVLGVIGGIAGGLLGAYVGEEVANEWADDVAVYLEEVFTRGRRWVGEEFLIDTRFGQRDLHHMTESEFLEVFFEN